MRAVSLHRDVIVVTSALLALNCVVVRSPRAGEDDDAGECFVIDSPALPDELELLGSLISQSSFPAPNGLLATHADWDHLLARIAFPELPLGCAASSHERLRAHPGAPQRQLREFDERLYIERSRPLSLGALQALPVPGSCEIGREQLELAPADGHTCDGMAVWIGWARVLVAGDYLSALEIPSLGEGSSTAAYAATLERLRPLVAQAEHVVPGHGPVVSGARAAEVLEEDLAYLRDLEQRRAGARLPRGARSREQRALHEANVRAL